MATRRRRSTSTRRRRNPARTTGMILVNPRRRSSTRKRTRARSAVRRRRNPATRRRTTRRTTARRRNPSTRRRRNPARRRTTARRRRTTRRRNGGQIVVRRRNGRRRNPVRRRSIARRRRNPARRRNPGAMFNKIPLVGPILANIVGLGPHALLGAISVEPVMAIVKLAAPYMPMVPASLFYAGAGLIAAAIVPFLPYFSKATKDKLALAMASATAGVAYYKWRTGQDIEVVTEAAVVEMSGAGFGGLIPGPSSGMYTPPEAIPASFGDAYGSGGGYWQVGAMSGVGGAY